MLPPCALALAPFYPPSTLSPSPHPLRHAAPALANWWSKDPDPNWTRQWERAKEDAALRTPEEKAAVMENAQKVEAAVTSTVDTLFAVGAF